MMRLGILLSLVLISSLTVPVAMAQVTHNITAVEIEWINDSSSVRNLDLATAIWVSESKWKLVGVLPPNSITTFLETVKVQTSECAKFVPVTGGSIALSAFNLTNFSMCADENIDEEILDDKLSTELKSINNKLENLEENDKNDWKENILIAVGVGTIFGAPSLYFAIRSYKNKINN